MVAVSARARERLGEPALARFYFDLRRALEFSHLGQTPWTPPISILYALDVALARYQAAGMQAAFERHSRYANAVRESLQGLGFALLSQPGAHSDTIVAAYPPPGVDPNPLLRALREEHGIVLSGGQAELAGKIVRFGTMGDVHESDFQTAFAAIEVTLAALTSGVA
jgi:aspartate aminotransferase-like enzyme